MPSFDPSLVQRLAREPSVRQRVAELRDAEDEALAAGNAAALALRDRVSETAAMAMRSIGADINAAPYPWSVPDPPVLEGAFDQRAASLRDWVDVARETLQQSLEPVPAPVSPLRRAFHWLVPPTPAPRAVDPWRERNNFYAQLKVLDGIADFTEELVRVDGIMNAYLFLGRLSALEGITRKRVVDPDLLATKVPEDSEFAGAMWSPELIERMKVAAADIEARAVALQTDIAAFGVDANGELVQSVLTAVEQNNADDLAGLDPDVNAAQHGAEGEPDGLGSLLADVTWQRLDRQLPAADEPGEVIQPSDDGITVLPGDVDEVQQDPRLGGRHGLDDDPGHPGGPGGLR